MPELFMRTSLDEVPFKFAATPTKPSLSYVHGRDVAFQSIMNQVCTGSYQLDSSCSLFQFQYFLSHTIETVSVVWQLFQLG